MESSVAKLEDIDMVAACISQAFAADPIWSVALSRRDGVTDHHQSYWRITVEGAMRFGTVHQWESGAAVSVWIPPGESELTPELEAQAETLLAQSLDAKSLEAMDELYHRFEKSRVAAPRQHAYLALLATNPKHRGRGIGQALLASDLRHWDALGVRPISNHRTQPMTTAMCVRASLRSGALQRYSMVQR